MRIAVTGAAGLVGQNLITRLHDRGDVEIVAIDKHPANVRILRALHPDVTVIEADLAEEGPWRDALRGCQSVVIGHAQIGGLDRNAFERNNVLATHRLLEAVHALDDCHLVHISSSVVNSAAVDWYTESKKAQEAQILAAGLSCVVLRPTLMFGFFDRKHLGWLARFMRKSPVFPIPGTGRFRRQPLYAGDFCAIVEVCLRERRQGAVYDISGLETIDYVDLIELVRDAAGAKCTLVPIPYRLFWLLLASYGAIDRNPPFTVKQLEALVIPEEFPVIDWPEIFGVRPTPLAEAMRETFAHPRYASIVLEF